MNRCLMMAIMSVFLVTGCTWVHLTPEAEQVRMATDSEIVECSKVGQTTVSLLAKIAGVNRSQKKVVAELVTLGRNSAAEMGGDTIVPASEIEDGEQSFDVYRCVKP